MAKKQLTTGALNTHSTPKIPDSLFAANIFDEDNTKPRKSITQTPSTAIEGNLGARYNEYLESLGAIQKSNASGTTVTISTNSGELVEVVPISFQEYMKIQQNKGVLPTKEDYLNKQHEVKSENSQVVQTGEPTAISLDQTTNITIIGSTTITSNGVPTSLESPTFSTTQTSELVTPLNHTTKEESSDDSSENLGDFLEGSHLLKSLTSWDLKRSNLGKSSILEKSILEESKLKESKLEVSSISEAEQEKIAKELIIRSLKVINNPELKKRVLANLKDSQNLDLSAVSDFTQSSVEEEKALISAEEALYFKQFISVFSTLHEERSAVANIVPKSNDDLTHLTLNKDEIEKSSEKTLLDDPEFTISVFKDLFPKANITASWHVLFPNCSIKEVWAQNYQKLTLEEFWNKCFKHEMPSAKDAQQYKDLAMLQSAKKSDNANVTSLYQSTCDNSLGVSALPDAQSEEFKAAFKTAINQVGSTELAKKILDYNYPEDNFPAAPEVENNRENQEVVLSEEEAQFFRNFVCAMLKPSKGQNIEGINTLASQLLLQNPRDVAQWFEMCFPNVHLPKSWEVLFPDTSIIELWKNSHIMAADTFSKFCQIVFPNYKLSGDNLQPGQEKNLDLFLYYKPKDKLDIGAEALSQGFGNLFAEELDTNPLNEPEPEPDQPLVKSTSEDSSKSIEDSSKSIIEYNKNTIEQSHFTENKNIILYYTTGATNAEQNLIQDISIEQSTSIEASGSSTDGVENKNIISYYLTLSSNPTTTTGKPIAPQTPSGSEIIPQETKEEKEEAQDKYITVSQGGQAVLPTSNKNVTHTAVGMPIDIMSGEELTPKEIEELRNNWDSISNFNANNLESESQSEIDIIDIQYNEYLNSLGTFNNEDLVNNQPTIVITSGTVSFHVHYPSMFQYQQGHRPTKEDYIKAYQETKQDSIKEYKEINGKSFMIISIPMESSDQAKKLDDHFHAKEELQDPQTPKVETPQQPPSASKGFFSGVFGFFTAPIFSAWSGLNSLLGLKKAAPTPVETPEGTNNFNKNKVVNNALTQTQDATSSADDITTLTPQTFQEESRSFVGKISHSISSIIHAIGSLFGESQATAPDTQNNDTGIQVLGKTPDETTQENGNIGGD